MFREYSVTRVTRDCVGSKRWLHLVQQASPEDLVVIHSSGDFGSKYRRDSGSWHVKRKTILSSFPNHRIIHLPTTVYYENDVNGKNTLDEDRISYQRNDLVLLCREEKSLHIAGPLGCRKRFFPDVVFYLKPRLIPQEKQGALVILRELESQFSDDQRDQIRAHIASTVKIGLDEDIHVAKLPLLRCMMEKYMDSVFQIYQRHEVVVTDRMHAMIFAVINQIPCVALDDAIPHKISGYKHFLSKSVHFVDRIDQIPDAIGQAIKKPYRKTDLSKYFVEFGPERFVEWCSDDALDGSFSLGLVANER